MFMHLFGVSCTRCSSEPESHLRTCVFCTLLEAKRLVNKLGGLVVRECLDVRYRFSEDERVYVLQEKWSSVSNAGLVVMDRGLLNIRMFLVGQGDEPVRHIQR